MHDRSSSAEGVSSDDPAKRAAAPAGQPQPATPLEAQQVEYLLAHSHPPSAAPGLVLGMLGLGLVFLGGCFCFGLMILHQSSETVWSTTRVYFYMVTLYVLAGLCFSGAFLMLTLAVMSLLKAARR